MNLINNIILIKEKLIKKVIWRSMWFDWMGAGAWENSKDIFMEWPPLYIYIWVSQVKTKLFKDYIQKLKYF